MPKVKTKYRGNLGSTVGPDDYRAPFCVEYSNDPNSPMPSAKYFTDAESAEIFADKMAENFRAVWQSQLGVYATRFETERTNCIYYWWSNGADYGELPSRGWGHPCDYLNALIKYDGL